MAIHRLQVSQGPFELRVIPTDYHANRALIEASRTSMILSSRDLKRSYMRQEIWMTNKDGHKAHGVFSKSFACRTPASRQFWNSPGQTGDGLPDARN